MPWKIKLNGTFFVILIFVIVALAMSVLLMGSEEDYSDILYAQNGLLTLSQERLNYPIPLAGEWLYFENQLLTGPVTEKNIGIPVKLPHQWQNSYYGSYQLTIEGLKDNRCYSIYLHDNGSAFALYLDGQLKAKNGVVSTSKTNEVMEWQPMTLTFMPTNGTVRLMLQISNHHAYPLVFSNLLYLGESQAIDTQVINNMAKQMILFGGIMIICLFNLSLFILNTKEKASLYFAIFCLVAALRIPLTGERLVNSWIPNLNWFYLWKFLFITGSMMLGSFALFIQSLFKKYCHPVYIIFINRFVLISVITIFVLTPAYLGLFDYVFLVVSITFFAYLVFILLKAIKEKAQGSVFSFVGVTFILGSILLDMIMPAGNNSIPIGIFIFLIFQSLVIGEKYSSIAEQNLLLSHVATRDTMTNLYKKDYFSKLVNTEITSSESHMRHTMLFIDIDNFKFINDTYGHDFGDEVIIDIAEKILRSLRYQDIACRFGGDEFIIWLHNLDADESIEVATTILNHIIEPIIINEMSIRVSVSIGMAFYPKDAITSEGLITVSDTRMYTAKSKGKNQYAKE